MSWLTEVTNGDGSDWVPNRLLFEHLEEATAYVTDQKNRDKRITDTRVIPCTLPAAYRYINGELLKKVELRAPLPEDIEP